MKSIEGKCPAQQKVWKFSKSMCVYTEQKCKRADYKDCPVYEKYIGKYSTRKK